MSPALAIAAALVLVIAISSLLYVRRAQREHALEQMLDMHVAALASANPVDVVSSDRHTVKPWFQGKLPFTFNLPELAGSQYKLNGGKLVYFRGKPAAQLIFELGKHELSVFIAQDGAGTAGVSDANENGFSTEPGPPPACGTSSSAMPAPPTCAPSASCCAPYNDEIIPVRPLTKLSC